MECPYLASPLTGLQKHKAREQFGQAVEFYSATNVRRVVRAALTIVAVVILVGPLFALNYAKQTVLRLVLIGVFALCFALAISFGTKSRNFEIFAAIAA